MPNNQDAVREWGLCPLHLHNQKLDCADCQEIREANARLDAKLRAPTPREQELEAALVKAKIALLQGGNANLMGEAGATGQVALEAINQVMGK